MRRLDEFRVFYNHTIHPELMRMERHRRRLWRLMFFSAFLIAGIIVMEFYLRIPLFSLMLLMGVFFYIAYLAYRIQHFRNTFKPNVINLLLDFIDDGPNYGTLRYDPKGFIPRKTFRASHIFASRAPEYRGEDLITGKIGELEFQLCELNVREFSRVRNRLDYVFRGVFLTSKFNHEMAGAIVILPREFKQYLTRSIKAITRKGAYAVDPQVLDDQFNQYFMTYATAQVNLHQMLSPDLQTAILEYRLRTDKKMYFSFLNQQVYIAITEPKDLLEPYILRSNVSFELVREFFEDLEMVLRIVAELDRNN
ncbi:MAG: DUF3137 domain-containing protein [Bacteroidota bacterium]